MTLAALLNVPRNENEWNFWSLNHHLETLRLQQAIQKKTNGSVKLFQYQLDPIPFSEPTEWLQREQQSHQDFNTVLNLQSVDLEGVDLQDPKQLQAWIWLEWLEHSTANLALGI